MPAEIQNGKAVLFGITNNGVAIAISGYATFILDTLKGVHKFRLAAIEDENDADTTLIATNGHMEMPIVFTPSGASRAAAAAVAVILTPLAQVVLSNYKVGAFNGTWIYVGEEAIDLSHGAVKMSLPVRKYDDATQNSLLATTVSG